MSIVTIFPNHKGCLSQSLGLLSAAPFHIVVFMFSRVGDLCQVFRRKFRTCKGGKLAGIIDLGAKKGGPTGSTCKFHPSSP